MQTLFILLFSQIVSVPFINLMFRMEDQPSCLTHEAESYLHLIAYLAALQVLLFYLGFLSTRGSLFRRTWYNNIMPELAHYSIFVAMLLIPAINIALSIAYVAHGGLNNLFWLNLLSQVSTIVWFLIEFYTVVNIVNEMVL